MDRDQYCREIESYLCRKNDGHLIRIVGPSFERVCSWAARGVPVKVAFRGIDRYFERYYAKGPRRRPVRIDFCEADVLDVFDEWRRAVGVPAAGGDPDGEEGEAARRRRSTLPSHLDRVLARLADLRANPELSQELQDALGPAVQELEATRAGVKGSRGEARGRLLARLTEIDRELLAAARRACPEDTMQALRAEAEEELGSFRQRMPEAAYQQAVDASINRLLRQQIGLPQVALQ